jgi:hypothetical protein
MKTARQLKIKPWEHRALLVVRDLLDAKQLTHTKPNRRSLLRKPGFDMNTIPTNVACGSVACIGGWMHIVEHVDAIRGKIDGNAMSAARGYVCNSRSSSLRDLFFPYGASISWCDITQKMAVKAIDCFLDTGDPKWEAATA